MRTFFSSDEIEELRSNPYTAYVTSDTLRYTLSFKKYALKAYNSGKKPREIFREAGYNPDLLGSYRMSDALRKIRNQAASPKGLRPDPAEKKADAIQSKGKTVDDLQKRINYLEDEVALLKKVSN